MLINAECERTLLLLDLRTVFETVDHDILLKPLKKGLGLSGTVLGWSKSYIKIRDLFVTIGNFSSDLTKIICGLKVPPAEDLTMAPFC